jgi:hypothetical protein
MRFTTRDGNACSQIFERSSIGRLGKTVKTVVDDYDHVQLVSLEYHACTVLTVEAMAHALLLVLI